MIGLRTAILCMYMLFYFLFQRQRPDTLDMHGLYVEEALEALEKWLKTAEKGGFNSVGVNSSAYCRY